jgi:hypothetical protein
VVLTSSIVLLTNSIIVLTNSIIILGGDTREQKDALESQLPGVIYHRVYNVYEDSSIVVLTDL